MTEDTKEIAAAKLAVLMAIRDLMKLTGKPFELSDVVDLTTPADTRTAARKRIEAAVPEALETLRKLAADGNAEATELLEKYQPADPKTYGDD